MIGVLKGIVSRAATTTPGGDERPRWVVIAIVSWAEAEVMRSKLESEGFPCLLQREAAGTAFGITIGPMGEVRVLVPETLADRALELLNDRDAGTIDDPLDDEDIDDVDTGDET